MRASEPLTFTAALLVVVLLALASASVPAWRAIHTDPAVTLRDE